MTAWEEVSVTVMMMVEGPVLRRPETRWIENTAHFHSALTGPFRADDPGRSAPLWGCLALGLIGVDSGGMGLKQRNTLLLPASPLPTHLCHSPITAHNQPSLFYSSVNLKHPPRWNKVIFPPTALILFLFGACHDLQTFVPLHLQRADLAFRKACMYIKA